MRNSFDWTPYRRSTVGFDRLFDFLETGGSGAENYPPFDIEKIADDHFRITIAVAGFKPDEIDITAQQNMLNVSGRKAPVAEGEERQMLYSGIATRAFERRFQLADFVRVDTADLADGLEVGMLGINNTFINMPETPFGGVKQSGYGSEGGIEGMEAYLVTKTVSQS